MDQSNLKKTKRTISIVAGFSRNTKQTTNEKLNLIPVDVQKADKCAKIAKTDAGKGLNLIEIPLFETTEIVIFGPKPRKMAIFVLKWSISDEK